MTPIDVYPAPTQALVFPNVRMGAGTVLEEPCVVGKPPRGESPGSLETRLGEGCLIRHFTTLYAGTVLGDGVQTGQGASIRENNRIGNRTSIGTNAVLEHGNRIGERVRIHSGCFLELATIEDDVFVGPNVVFADDLHPPCPNYEDCVGGAVIRKGASIGANATLLPGVVVGQYAIVGAGAVVVADVPDYTVVVGSPARVVCGVEQLKCRRDAASHPYAWREPA